MAKQSSLFGRSNTPPLAERMRPRTLDEFCGQQHLLGPGKALRVMIETDRIPSLIFWGPPGCGKTTLAHIVAHATGSRFVFFSAIMAGIREIREIFKEAEEEAFKGKRTILFVDEIHRFNKAQQDAFLPAVEKGLVTIIGATTENPSFEVIAPLLSRCRVLRLKQLEPAEIANLVRGALADRERGLGSLGLAIDDEALEFLAEAAQGDGRKALNTLEVAAQLLSSPGKGEGGRSPWRSCRRRCSRRRCSMTKGGKSITTSSLPLSNLCAAVTRTPLSTGWPACWRPGKTRSSSCAA